MEKAIFITIEGIDGCGKTTQAKLLSAWFLQNNLKHILTKEPGGTEIGRRIRDILLAKTDIKISAKTELLLFLADRLEHLIQVIKPSLDKGYTVLCERYIDSTLAYQVGGSSLNEDVILSLHKQLGISLMPQKTILLDIPADLAFKRIKNPDRFEERGIGFLKKVRDYYLKLASNEPYRFVVIDATKPVDVVFEQIKQKLGGILLSGV